MKNVPLCTHAITYAEIRREMWMLTWEHFLFSNIDEAYDGSCCTLFIYLIWKKASINLLVIHAFIFLYWGANISFLFTPLCWVKIHCLTNRVQLVSSIIFCSSSLLSFNHRTISSAAMYNWVKYVSKMVNNKQRKRCFTITKQIDNAFHHWFVNMCKNTATAVYELIAHRLSFLLEVVPVLLFLKDGTDYTVAFALNSEICLLWHGIGSFRFQNFVLYFWQRVNTSALILH